MLYLCTVYAASQGKRPLIAAARNVHSTFLSAAVLLDFDIHWLYSHSDASYLSCIIDPHRLDQWLCSTAEKPVAVYLTSPDYLGCMSDIRSISSVCHKHGVLLAVDNAHGAYLRFLPSSIHPIDLGADICCDSAHKTLPVLTGGAYLHLGPSVPDFFVHRVKQAMALFASTSPSYLILQSLDNANVLIETYPARLSSYIPVIEELRASLIAHGYVLQGQEILKITICPKLYGYTGIELAAILEQHNIVGEFADQDHVVLMLTPMLGNHVLMELGRVLLSIPRREPIEEKPPRVPHLEQVLSPREASFLPRETIPVTESEGRILAAATVGCPPAVPIVVCGERIDRAAIEAFAYYGIKECVVVVEK
jgi:arginine/lysine/ornithine decarboxylase